MFTVDEMRAKEGLPPETPEERAARKQREAERKAAQVQREAEAAARARQAAEAKEAARLPIKQVFDAAIQSKDVNEFLKVVVSVRDQLCRNAFTPQEMTALSAKAQAMMEQRMVTRDAEQLAAIGEVMTRLSEYRQSIAVERPDRAGIIRSPKAETPPPAPPPEPPAPPRPPKTFWENLGDLFKLGKQ